MKGFEENIRVVLKSLETSDRIEIQGCLVQQISKLEYVQAKELINKIQLTLSNSIFKGNSSFIEYGGVSNSRKSL